MRWRSCTGARARRCTALRCPTSETPTMRRISRRMSMCRCGTARRSTAHRFPHGLAAGGVPQPVPDASAAGGTPHRAPGRGMGRHSCAGVRTGCGRRVLLQHALASLGDEERRIVLLHAVTGMKHREIAALLELPLPTVLSKYHRALKKMRSCLEGDDAR